ncbi:alcohol dehydrogenase [Fusarium beomiforme]|uniref:Alcohol dehydrogenase n=1 Tax=Fusarium beomiforme TaxID=44412 RepID=A0A9P5ADL3_9HYPO|nr:alcohol dehydrogenase [Fusarium beomiforme]
MPNSFNPYENEHVNASGPGDSRPTAYQIIKDEDVVGKLSDKVILITGASSGIGIETARALHETGAKLFLGVRNLGKGRNIVDQILGKSSGVGDIELLQMELSSTDSVRQAADEFRRRSNKLNIMVNNAGITGPDIRAVTKDGFEAVFATNYLGHFLLFQLLKPMLLSSASPNFCSRVVTLSSLRHRVGKVNFDDLNSVNYDRATAYSQSKLANIWMANHITRLYASQSLFSTSVHPGLIFTPAARAMPSGYWNALLADENQARYIKNEEQGAATTVWAAVGRVWEGKGGKYLEDVSVRDFAPNVPDISVAGPSKLAYNPEGEERLWEVSHNLLGSQSDGR